MPATNRLSDAAIRAAEPGENLYDGEGLSLRWLPSGARWWRFDYRHLGRRKTMSLGLLRDVPLKTARAKRRVVREQVARGLDPAIVAAFGGADTFSAVADDFLERQAPKLAPKTLAKKRWIVDAFLRPRLGPLAMSSIGAGDLLLALRAIEAKGRHDTAHTARALCGQVFRFAIATGRADRNPAGDLLAALAPVVRRHRAALTKPDEVGTLLVAIDTYVGTPVVSYALRILPHVFVRPFELRAARWREIDLEARLWRVPAERMKMRQEHLVPLSPQVVTLLEELRALTGHGSDDPLVFPGHRSRKQPMSDAAINAALRQMGYRPDQVTGHGFRSTARTLLDEVLQMDPSWIEVQLAHTVPGPLGSTYNRSLYLPQRTAMMTRWSAYLDSLKAQALAKADKRPVAMRA